MKVEIYKVAF